VVGGVSLFETLLSIFFCIKKRFSKQHHHPNIIMWQFEDGKPNSGIWKNMLAGDQINLKRAMRQGEKSTTIENRFGKSLARFSKKKKHKSSSIITTYRYLPD
jgi:hypothetical protein